MSISQCILLQLLARPPLLWQEHAWVPAASKTSKERAIYSFPNLWLYPPMAKSHTLPFCNQASSPYDNFLVESEITVFRIFTVCCIDLKLIEYEVINKYHQEMKMRMLSQRIWCSVRRWMSGTKYYKAARISYNIKEGLTYFQLHD